MPKADTLARIAKALDVSADYLLGLSYSEKSLKSSNVQFPETCADAIDLLDKLLYLDKTDILVSEKHDLDGFEYEVVTVIFSEPGLVKYYQGIESIKRTLSALPDSLSEAAWKFQSDARKKLYEEAKETKLQNYLTF